MRLLQVCEANSVRSQCSSTGVREHALSPYSGDLVVLSWRQSRQQYSAGR